MNIDITRTICLVSLIITGIVPSSVNAAVPIPVQDDNGNASFVRQIVPKLLGRKPKGILEVNLLKDIADIHGREAVVRLMMEQDEFTSHWTATLIDHMKVQRAVELQNNRKQSAQCFEEVITPPSSLATGAQEEMTTSPFTLTTGTQELAPESALAAFVRDSAYNIAYHEEFNMHDLIKSSIALDNLFPAYRGYLFTLGGHPNGTGMRTVAAARAEVGVAFDDIFLNRNMACMSCHRGTYSTTGIGERTHPLYQSLEAAVFDHSVLDSNPPDAIQNAHYIQYCAGCHGSNGTNGVVQYETGGVVLVRDVSAEKIKTSIDLVDQMSGLQGVFSPVEINSIADALISPSALGKDNIAETALKHYAAFRSDFFAIDNPEASDGPWKMNNSCASILGNVSGAVEDDNDNAIQAFFAGVASNTLTVGTIDELLLLGYNDLPITFSSPLSLSYLDPNFLIPGRTALAYMLAAKITDNVWEQLMGERLTIVNQFARNAWQKEMHQHLTENVFLANDWSLKELIVEILRTRFFNRHPPASSIVAGPYRLHPMFDPFIVADQTCQYYESDGSSSQSQLGIAHSANDICAFNGQGELVHRYSPRSLLSSISQVLAWPMPKIFPVKDYPSEKFSAAIGQYTSDFDVGNKEVSFQALLEWDDQYGVCAPDDEIYANGSINSGDWLDHLIENIDDFNNTYPKSPLTLGELVLTLKDWLLQEPVFGGYEPQKEGFLTVESQPIAFDNKLSATTKNFSEDHLVSHLFELNLDETVTSNSIDESKLRDLCGVYLKTPQFMLAGLIRNETFTAPRYRICNDQNCSYYEMCRAYKAGLSELGYGLACQLDSVSIPIVRKLSWKFAVTGNAALPSLSK